MTIHDYKRFPELTNAQLQEFGFMSPHIQITHDFHALVVKVHDGDTVTLQTSFRDFNFKLRLLDIDAPELNEGGETAKVWLSNEVLKKNVYIQIDKNNRVGKYGRLLGRILYRGLNMGDTMLRLGLVEPFGKKNEYMIPAISQELEVRKWLQI